MSGAEPLEILVDTNAQAALPKKLADALRRQLRDHDIPRSAKLNADERSLLTLIESREGRHLIPQALLSRLTDTCRRHGVPYAVIDRRAMVSCRPFRSQDQLSDRQREAVQRLLLRDSGVLVAEDDSERRIILGELIAKRQQRTLIITRSTGEATLVRTEIGTKLGIADPLLGDVDHIIDDSLICFVTYATARRLTPELLRGSFGLVVFDRVDIADPIDLMGALRAAGARYLVGLAQSPVRSDDLQDRLYLALGGIAHELTSPSDGLVRLHLTRRETPFTYAYNGRDDYQALLAALAADPERIRMIAADIARAARAGEACLVLSERKDHLDALAAALPSDVTHARATSDERPTERNRVVAAFNDKETDVLFATSQVALQLAQPLRATELFITFPFSYVKKLEELVALLTRPQPGKKDATIVDYDDTNALPLSQSFGKRAQIFSRLARALERKAHEASQLPLRLSGK